MLHARVVAAVTLVAGVLLAMLPGAAWGYTAPPPWVGSDGAKGSVRLFDASGAELFSGDDISQIAAWITASSTADAGATTATLAVAVPSPSALPSSWCTRPVQSNTTFSPAPTPRPADGTEFAGAIAGGAAFLPLNPALAPGVENATLPPCAAYAYGGSGTDYSAAFSHVLELRLADTLDGTYWRTVIEFNPTEVLDTYDGLDPGQWRVVHPVPTLIPTAVGTPTASPATNPLTHGATVTLTVHVSASNGTHQDGAVEFYDDLDGAFYSPYTAWDPFTGTAELEVTPTDGDHAFYARFTPASARYTDSVSPRLDVHVNRRRPALTGSGPALTGAGLVGQTLTCGAGAWDATAGWPYTYAYEWLSTAAGQTSVVSTVPPGASTSVVSPTLTQSLYGRDVSCRVTVRNGDGSSVTATSGSVTVHGGPSPVTPRNQTPPSIASARVGQASTCAAGVWSQGGLTFTYDWMLAGDDAPFRHVTTSASRDVSKPLPSAAEGRSLICQVSARNADGASASEYSGPLEVRAAARPPAVRTAPAVTIVNPAGHTPVQRRTPAVGATATCAHGTWTGSGLRYRYVWRVRVASGTRTLGFSNRRVLPVQAYAGTLTCSVTATNSEGLSATRTVAVAARVGLGPAPTLTAPAALHRPRIIAGPRVGVGASASRGAWTWVPRASTFVYYRYVWVRYPAAAGGRGTGTPTLLGSGQRYTPTAADRGGFLAVRLVVHRTGYAHAFYETAALPVR